LAEGHEDRIKWLASIPDEAQVRKAVEKWGQDA
jgi:hypothetical protein